MNFHLRRFYHGITVFWSCPILWLLILEPQLADVLPYDEYPINPQGVSEIGVLAPVGDASAEMGRALYEDLVNGFVRCVRSAF